MSWEPRIKPPPQTPGRMITVAERPLPKPAHRWIDRGVQQVCIKCSTLLERATSPKTGRLIKVYKKNQFWSAERPECVWQ